MVAMGARMRRHWKFAAAWGLALLVMLGAASPATAEDGYAVQSARARLDAARGESEQAALQYLANEAELGRIEARIGVLELRIPRVEKRIGELRGILRERAAVMYEGGGGTGITMIDTVLKEGDIMDGGRVAHLADVAAEETDETADELDERRDQLAKDKKELGDTRKLQEELVAESKKQSDILAMKMEKAAGDLRRAQQEQALERYRAAVAARRAQWEAAAAAAAFNGTPPPPEPRAQTPPGDPALAAEIPVSQLLCPIDAMVTFVDDWGQPRSSWRVHQGTDIFAARGTPNVAVANGIARKRPGELAGNGLWLQADDGHAYFYAHLESYEGEWAVDGTRRVVRGDVVGYTGDTGNAKGGPIHTHFQVHPRALGPINPYPLLREMCKVQLGLVDPPPDDMNTQTPTTTVLPPSTTTPTAPPANSP
jgi:murein DD-endopeptidase MepM/ murein hydrolase activator NlpD